MTRGGSVYFCHDKQKDLMQGIFFFCWIHAWVGAKTREKREDGVIMSAWMASRARVCLVHAPRPVRIEHHKS